MISKLIQAKIRTTLFVTFSMLSLMVLGMIFTLLFIEKQSQKISGINAEIARAISLASNANTLQKDFFLFEVINTDFYATRESNIALQHQYVLDSINFVLGRLETISSLPNAPMLSSALKECSRKVDALEKTFNKLVALTLNKGFKDWGVIGRMRSYIHSIENTSLPINQVDMLMARRHEKDYLLRKQDQYPTKLKGAVARLRENILTLPPSAQRAELLNALEGYESTFLEMVGLEQQIGYEANQGVKNELFNLNKQLIKDLLALETQIKSQAMELQTKQRYIIIGLSIVAVFITLFAGWFVNRKLGKPIVKLSQKIHEGIESDFKSSVKFSSTNKLKDEIGQISNDVEFMYEKVQYYISELITQREEVAVQAENLSKANTKLEENAEYIEAKNVELENQNQKVLAQKEKLEENYYNIQMLTLIGQQITLNLNIEDIVHVVHDNVSDMLDVSIFAIGIHRKEKNILEFYGAEGKNSPILHGEDSLDEDTLLSVHCFTSGKEIIIGNIDIEYQKYVSKKPEPRSTIRCKSYIYLPLAVKQQIIGVISVQSQKENAYDDFSLNIFRNLATYSAVAIENARGYEKISIQQIQLRQQSDRLEQANREISKKNKALTSSINYAQRIQSTILPRISDIKHHFPESFVLFKPRDIVSGDFYFFSVVPQLDGKGGKNLVIAAADCTGHGVPGAFTSMVGSGLLNTVVNKKGETKPSAVLRQVNVGIQHSFRQNETDNKDGMDIGLAVVNLRDKTLDFAGAKSNLVYIQDGELHLVKGSKASVGGGRLTHQRAIYDHHVIDISRPTTFYMFSDGFQDQFGGPQRRKITSKKFRELLLSIQDKSMEEQHEFLEQYLKDWMTTSNESQVDDILVMGFRIA